MDESGNAGWNGSPYYSLGCVMVDAVEWPSTFDALVNYRRWLRDSFGVLLRDEVKANYLVKNKGRFKRLALGEQVRHRIYRSHMRLLPKVGMEAFAVLTHKDRINKQATDPREWAWQFLLQRLERMSTKADFPVMVVPDEGEDKLVRQFTRRARRAALAGQAFGGGWTPKPFTWLVEDPFPKRSDHSFFVQFADLVAYAAYRRLYPYQGNGRIGEICPQGMWDEIGEGIYKPAAQLVGDVDGLVEWPK